MILSILIWTGIISMFACYGVTAGILSLILLVLLDRK